MLLDIVAKPHSRGGVQPVNSTKEKFEVTTSNVAYLAALVSVSEEVRSRCHVRHTFADVMPDSPTFDSFVVDTHLKTNQQNQSSNNSSTSHHPPNVLRSSGMSSPVNSQHQSNDKEEPATNQAHNQIDHPANSRQKSLDGADCSGASSLESNPRSPNPNSGGVSIYNKQPAGATVSTGGGLSSTPTNLQVGPRLEKRANSVACVSNSSLLGASNQTVNKSLSEDHGGAVSGYDKQNEGNEDENYTPVNNEDEEETPAANASAVNVGGASNSSAPTPRPSISNENNILLDPEVLTDQVTQVLVLTVMATLVKYTTNESEVRILYEYLAEASVVFPKVFPIIHSLLDAKITNVLSLCHDKTILASVQSIIENMIACEEEKSQQQLHFLQSCGFGGLWRFAGNFTKSNSNAENVELFSNALEAMVETALMVDQEQEENISHNSLLSVVSSNIKMSSSLTSLSLASPTDKAAPCGGIDGAVALASGSSNTAGAASSSGQSGGGGANLNGHPF